MSQFVKDFLLWFSCKRQLDASSHTPPFFKEGEVWWCGMGENVGGEISGKGKCFRRPVFIVRKLDKYSFIGLPLTSQSKVGSWYKKIVVKNKDNFLVLPQIRHMDYRRMDKVICRVSEDEFREIRESLVDLIFNL